MSTQITNKLISWASVIDEGTIRQATKTSRMDIVVDHIALMPDAHVGIGATVGSVIPTKSAVIPSAVGVDIGCGMIAVQLDIKGDQLPDNLTPLLNDIAVAVPSGVGTAHTISTKYANNWFQSHSIQSDIIKDHLSTASKQFGTLGSGNHFIEICLDENNNVWIVLHSGSRGIGNKVGTTHIKTAKSLAKQLEIRLEDPDLAYFMEGTPEFQAYINDMLWCQEYAKGNRDAMMNTVLNVVVKHLGIGREINRINCHHNFTQKEIHNNAEMWITRKGAIKADIGDMGIIPGSMGTSTFIVKGKGNVQSWKSCSHGAGRKMSRGEARRNITTEHLVSEMEGKTWLVSDANKLIDESPSSYKDINQVMQDQNDLIEIVHTLYQVLNYKGT